MKKQRAISFVKSYFFITFGLLINVFGWVAFLIPAEIVGGGITGLSSIIFYITGFPIGISVLLFNSILVLLAMKILGAKIGLASVFGIATVSALFFILPEVITQPIISDRFMSALIGGAFAGVGIGIAFVNGGNSGGTDIIALIINKYKNISPGRIILYIDIMIIASSYFISRKIETVVYGYVVMGVFAYTLDLILDGAKQSYQLTVMSKKSHEIADEITLNVGRGVTLMKGTGWYTKNEIDVLFVIIRKHDKQKVLRILAEIDNDAFISEAKVSAVFGIGFDRIKL
ncbi:MAG: YitT family protein [Bacteroidales bacterium]|nr:YitT family protein [Bacteroidales bacterium]